MAEAVALYDYNAQEHDELTLQKGDVITDIIVQAGGWWEGKLKGKRGMFPDNFVKLKGADGDRTASSEVTNRIGNGRKCKVLFSYHPENNDELKLKVNDIIEILDEVEEGWWKGKLRDEVGVFPSNFVCEINEEKLEGETETSEIKKPKSTQVEALKANESTTNHKDASQSSSRSTSVSTDSEVPLLPPKPVKEMCKVLFPYKAANDDELALKEGDIITIISKEVQDKGWWRGELNGQVGVFPDNFVQLLPIDESSKPARPPVKGATTNRTRDSLTKATTLSTNSPSASTDAQPPVASPHLPEARETIAQNDDKSNLAGILGKKPTLPPPPSKKPQRTMSGSGKPLAPTSPNPASASEATSPLQPRSIKPSETPPSGGKSPSTVPSASPKPTSTPHEASPLRSPRPMLGNKSDHSEVDGSCLSIGSSPRSYNLNHSSDSNSVQNDVDMDFDSIGRTAMLTHPTASRVRAPRRRPPSSIIPKDENISPGMMNGSADSHLEKQPTAAMSLVEELKLNYAKKQSSQGRTRVMIGQTNSGGVGDSPEPQTAKSPSAGVVLRSPNATPARPQSMYSGEKLSPSPRPSPSFATPSDTVTLSIKQWNDINDKIANLESTVESQREHFSKSIKELTSKVNEATERLMQMQLELNKVTDLVTQV